MDESRRYDGKGRPILFAVWYPASNARDTPIDYARYLQAPDVAAHPLFKGRLESLVRDVLSEDLFHKSPVIELENHASLSKIIAAYANRPSPVLTQAQRDARDRLLATRTIAHLDAPPLDGAFPVIIYHAGAGGSFEDNSLLFEYFASHGYVIVSSAFESPFPPVVANNLGSIENSIADLAFIARQARQWRYVDGSRLAAIGHSAGAQNLLRWVGTKRCPVNALVSLDTTIEYASESDRQFDYLRTAFRKLTPPRIPVLLFTQARRKPNFSAFDRYLRGSPHYEAQAADLSHNDFVTHGFLGRVLMREPDADAVRRSYEEVCRTIRSFLDATLKHAENSLNHVDPSSPVSIRYQPAH